MKAPRDHQARDPVFTQLAKAFHADCRRQTFQIGMFRCAQHLHTFLGEVRVEPREREPGTIDGRLANFPMETHAWSLELHLQFFGVRIIKALDRDNWNALLLIAWG